MLPVFSLRAQRRDFSNCLLFFLLGLCLIEGRLAWCASIPECSKRLHLQSKLEKVWKSFKSRDRLLNFEQAATLAHREAERIIGGRRPSAEAFLSHAEEREFSRFLPALLSPVLDHFLSTAPRATELAIQQLDEGVASERVVIVVHTSGILEASTARYLESETMQNVPVVALVSTSYPISNPRLLSQLSTARFSMSGELSQVRINADEVHLMGGAFGDCLTTATAQALEQMLNYPHRNKAIAHVHLQHSYGWKDHTNAWIHSPGQLDAQKLFSDFADRTSFGNYFNEALTRFELQTVVPGTGDEPYLEMQLKRNRDGKAALVRFYGAAE
jgi:hypothetical protein